MKRIPMILVLLLAFTFIALPVMSPVAATPVDTGAEPGTEPEITADSEPAGGGKGDPGGLGDGLGVDDPSQVPSSTVDGCGLERWDEMQERVVFLLYVMMFAD